MKTVKWKLAIAIIIMLQIPALIFGGISLYRTHQETKKPKVEPYAFDPNKLPDPPDSAIPKERTLTFFGKQYVVYYYSTYDYTINTSETGYYDNYKNDSVAVRINRETDKLICFSGCIGILDTETKQPSANEVREHVPIIAANFTQLDLTHYTVTEEVFQYQAVDHDINDNHVNERTVTQYIYRWTYRSEEPSEVVENSFSFVIEGRTIIDYECAEAMLTGYSSLPPHNPENEVLLQLSTTVPYPELPSLLK